LYYSIYISSSVCGITSSFTESSISACIGDTVAFTNTSTGAITYNWLEDGISFATTKDASRTFNNVGTYVISLIADSASCGDTSEVTISVTALPTIDLVTSTDASSCGASDGTINIAASGGTPPLQYSVDGGITFLTTNGFSGLSIGNYTIMVMDAVGCTITETNENISSPGSPFTSAGPDAVICPEDLYVLAGTMGGTASSITWTSSGSGSFGNANLAGTTYTPSSSDTAAGNVTLTITTDDPDAGGPCLPATDEMELTFIGATTPTITQTGNSLMSSTAMSYQWFFNGDSIAGETGQFYTPSQGGFYSVAIVDVNGCEAISVVQSIPLGIDNKFAGDKIEIYPNPNSGEFTLKVTSTNQLLKAQLIITNTIGQVVYREFLIQAPGTFQVHIDLSTLSTGMYHVRLLSDNETVMSNNLLLQR